MIQTTTVEVQSPLHYRYVQDEQFQKQFFEYKREDVSYEERIQYIQQRTYAYDDLYEVLYDTMAATEGLSEKTEQYLEDVRLHRAMFVVGGQQAGVLTGPLYTVHKAITAILLARKLRAEYQVAAVPLFWVAGEDHDIDEVNHTYVPYEGKAHKINGPVSTNDRQMVSATKYEPKMMIRFVEHVFRQFPETEETKPLFQKITSIIREEQTYTSFFLRLMNDLFKDEGLLYVDAADPAFKKMQSHYLYEMVMNERAINECVQAKEVQLTEVMQTTPIGVEEENTNLFYVVNGERYLIRRTEEGMYEADYGMWSGSKEQLLVLAKEHPTCLSNNVVTRPLMQEAMLPTLSFVAGPGEIAYWALLKEAFHLLELKMPIVEPRLSLTLVTRPIQRALKNTGLTAEQVLNKQLPKASLDWKQGQRNEQFVQELMKAEALLYEQYKQLEETAQTNALKEAIRQNYHYHKKQFKWLETREEQLVMEKNRVKVEQYRSIEEQLYPSFSLQERLYSPYVYMNTFGKNFIKTLLSYEYTFGGEHQILYL